MALLVRGKMRGVKLDYRKSGKRVGQKEFWVGVALWIIIALFLSAIVYGLCAGGNDPTMWR
jgi:uncharacterized membrane protein YhaH (DUF805 family)